MIRICLAA